MLKKDYVIKINTFQFYSTESKRMVTAFQLLHKEWQIGSKGKMVFKDKVLISTCSGVKVVKFMAEKYKELGG